MSAQRIEATGEQLELVRALLAGRLTNDRTAGRLDSRTINEDTGEVALTNDLLNLGKSLAIRQGSKGSEPRCGMKKGTIEDSPALSITTPSADGKPSQHVVLMHKDRDWEVWGCVPRPAGPGGKPRVELVTPRYTTWCRGAEPKWKVLEGGRKKALNAAAYNEWRLKHGMMPKVYNEYAEKHLLAALEREKAPTYCVPCDPKTGEPFDWVWKEIARGYAIEVYSWDHEFAAFDAEEVTTAA